MQRTTWGPFTLLLIALLGADAWWIATTKSPGGHTQWLATVALVVAFCVLAGYLVNSRIDGILISDRNRISLSRLQWTAWLIVLMSGYFVETMWNVGHAATSLPTMSNDLLGLLGIVSGSSVTAGLISNTKKQTDAPKAPGQRAAQPLAAAGDSPQHVGQMDANKTSTEASWADIYLGEEVSNRYVVDISRLQKLLVTIILVAIYVGWLWQALEPAPAAPEGFTAMPGLDKSDTFLWLLGISHAGYLASKATPKATPKAKT